ncbi:hypothetical protein RHSIM_Rhsim06G0146000 [Rhododendron simsii]|uniref:Ubiquitin-like protease family profile domain-containing protein n=1 Tax=Rhododendron simsii TaxID=118357 RepID=A0A834GUW6_RHOSS|nr:hypothetical protein RHSIM_Rhsim06G0146000 [Rhododendron simsii]
MHQVTRRATFEKIARLQKEKNDMEDELACIAVHKITQEAAKEKKKLNEQCSPRSMFKRVIARDDRKKNYSEDYVYGQVKRKSPQVNRIDVDDSPDYKQQQKGKKKKLKVNTKVDTIDVDKSPEYEQQEKGKKKKLKNLKDIIDNKKQEQLRRTLHNLMQQAASTRFLLFPILTSFHWTLLVLDKDDGKWKFYNPLLHRYGRNDEYCIKTKKLRVIIAAYINADKKQADKMLMTETVEIQTDSPQQTTGR